MDEQIAEILGRKYLIALTVVAILVLSDQALIQPYLMQLTTDPPLINVAGRQRMLSQRLVKAALAFEGGRGEGKAYLEEMSQVLGLWSAAQEQLVRNGPGPSWAGRSSAAVRDGLQRLDPYFVKIRDAAQRVIQAGASDPPGGAAVREGLAVILDNEAEYLRRMDQVVGLYESAARGRVADLRWIGWTVTGLILATLVAIGLFILRPAAGLIRRQISELRRARDELEDRVRERTCELEMASERHRALVEQFSHVARTTTIGEMASGLAHELNQPLGAIANYAEGCLVELAAPEPTLNEIRTALERLLATTLRAGQIIDRIRKFVTRHEPRRERFEPNRVVEDVHEILCAEAEQRGITVRLDLASDLPYLWGDSVQIQQVLVNLVRNAFEALAAQPLQPTLFMQTRRAESGGVEFAVIDNGEGIEPGSLDRVFDAYFSTRAGGMGMGLAICRTLIEAHQGRINVTSSPGVRTAFSFTLPAGSSDDGAVTRLHRG
jgi:two-component system, LuxR family, sensor kinase FixL